MANVDVIWTPSHGQPASFPCVDCGLLTGNFCDGGVSVAYDQCFAAERVPHDFAKNAGTGKQRTPLCCYCETLQSFCRFCRGVVSCTPPKRLEHFSRCTLNLSRDFNAVRRAYDENMRREFAAGDAVRADMAVRASIAAEVNREKSDEE